MQSGQEAGAAGQVARWEKARPAGVSKIDLTNVWGQEPTPLATAGVLLCIIGTDRCSSGAYHVHCGTSQVEQHGPRLNSQWLCWPS